MPDLHVFCGLPTAYSVLGRNLRFTAILGYTEVRAIQRL
jgi:hypothetical protein